MKIVVQRVTNANVKVEGDIIGEIEKGLVVLLGVKKGDTIDEADYLVKKILNLRIFEGPNGKMDLNVQQVNGNILIVSQFTVYGNCRDGNRPSFSEAEESRKAEKMYEYMVKQLSLSVLNIQQGKFGANMQVDLTNDGPITVIVEK